ncbi:Chromo domain-containing protein [Dirofilaria immitis]
MRLGRGSERLSAVYGRANLMMVWKKYAFSVKMMELRNKEDDDVNDLRLTDQATATSGNILDDLLEPDRVVQAEYFLEACSSEARIISNPSVIVGSSRELINNSEKKAENDNKTKQSELKISDVFEETKAISNIMNERKKKKLQSDGKDGKQQEMIVDSNKEDGNSENKNDTVDEGIDVKKDEKNGKDDDEYVVEKILDRRYNRRKKRIEYLIKWAGYDSESENTWESAENCKSAPEAIREYEENLKKSARKYLLRSRPITKESGPNDGGKESSKSLKRKTSEIKKELCSEESSDDDNEEVKSKRTKVDRILGVKKEDNEILALVRFEDGHHDLISTRVLVSKCPKKLVNYYERSLKFVSL